MSATIGIAGPGGGLELPELPRLTPTDTGPPHTIGGGSAATSLEGPLPQPGVAVAPGDPGAIGDLSAALAEGQRMLESHSTAICQTATAVAPEWEGEAGASYQQLASLVSAHFEAAAGKVGDASRALARYERELARCKREGLSALHQAEACIRQIAAQRGKLKSALSDESRARQDLADASAAADQARRQGNAGAAAQFDASAAAARRALTDAQTRAQSATRALSRLDGELKDWQRRGKQAWDEAEHAAIAATGSLVPILIAPPPLADIPRLPILTPAPAPELPSCVSASHAAAVSAGAGGSALAGDAGSLPGVLAGLLATLAGGALLAAEKAAESGTGGSSGSGSDGPVDVTVPRSRYPESAGHIDDAQKAGQPSDLTIGRSGAAARRRGALRGTPPVPGHDRDEYPPAVSREGGDGASVRPVPPGDNRGAGAHIGSQLKGYPDGTPFRVRTVD